MRLSLGVSALTLALLTAGAAPSALAGDGHAHRANLYVGPLIGGQPVRVDLRTTAPSAPLALLYGLDGTPTIPASPGLPVIGVNLNNAFVWFLSTDATGRLELVAPTGPNQFGAMGFGLKLYFQAIVVVQDGLKISSNIKATEIMPQPEGPGFLVEVAASHLPAGYDNLFGTRVEHVDINRDGYEDLVVGLETGLALWVNDGTGVFTDVTATNIALPGEAVSDVVAGDIDNDGDVDLLTAGGFDDFVSVPDRLWLNDGTGVFTEDTNLPAGLGQTRQLELADLDNDGDLDVIAAVGQEAHLAVPGGPDRLLFNLANGQFFESPDFETAAWNDPNASTLAIVPGDADSDGDLDLFVVHGSPARENTLLLNDGTGLFTDVSFANILPLHADNSQDATFADIDGDGDLDLLVANSVLGTPANLSGDVLINQGGKQNGTEGVFLDDAGSFLEPNTAADAIRLSIHAADIDADGDLDVLVTVHDLFLGADQALYLNQGGAQAGVTGTMVRQTWYDPGDFISYGAALFDMDHDGDLDVLQTADGVITGDPLQAYQTRLYENVHF